MSISRLQLASLALAGLLAGCALGGGSAPLPTTAMKRNIGAQRSTGGRGIKPA